MSAWFVVLGIMVLNAYAQFKFKGYFYAAICYISGGILAIVYKSWLPLIVSYILVRIIRYRMGDPINELTNPTEDHANVLSDEIVFDESKEYTGQEKVVLIVDDDKHLLKLLPLEIYDAFEGRIKTVEFLSPIDALLYLTSNKVDLVISCILFPDMDGITFLNECKSRYPQLLFIIYTSNDWYIKKGRKEVAAAEACIVKRADPSELIVAIGKLLSISPYEGILYE